MSIARLLSALAGVGTRRPLLVVSLALALAIVGAGFALRLHPTAATNTFVSGSSSQYRATQRFYANFGEEPVEIMVKGDLQQLVLSSDIERLLGLEGCLSGNVPVAGLAHEGGVHGPCGEIGRAHSVKVALGPGTFVSEAAEQIDEQLSHRSKQAESEAKQAERTIRSQALARGLSAAEADKLARQASKITLARYGEELTLLGLQYGLSSEPSLENANFVSRLVFDNSAKVAGTPKQRFAYLFPSREAALISVRMRAGLSEAQRTHTIALIRRALAMPQWHLQHGETYLLSGVPAIVSDLTGSITHSFELLLIAVLLVMALTLSLVFRGRPRLLPLGIALLAAALTFGALSAAGESLTIAQVAVLPILVGLAVDYAIQLQSRVGEVQADGVRDIRAAVRHAAAAGAPTIAIAGLASAVALLVLLLSPVPMVQGFGVLLIVGIFLAFLCALSVGSAALVLTHETPRRRAPRPAALLPSAWRGARELVQDNPLSRLIVRVALVHVVRRPGRVLAVGLALAILGWGLDTQTRVETDITKLVPQSLSSLHNLNALERASGVGGEIDLMVSSHELAKPRVIEWMSSYEDTVLHRYGYSASSGCGQARLCPAFSLPDLFQGAAGTSTLTGPAGSKASGGKGGGGKASTGLTQAQVSSLLAVIPPYFSQDVITPNRRVATLAFGIKLMSLDEQERVIEGMRAALHPPRGVDVQLVGLPVLAAQANTEVASPARRLLSLLVGLVLVALVLMLAFGGDRRRAFIPLGPIALATGWSALVLFATRVPLNPMSVTLGALVIAISTEFSVLLSERHRQERLAGHTVVEALRRSYRNTGAALTASAMTAIAGFGVLVLSDIRMLRDFGIVTLVDLSVSLLGVILALPAMIVWVEGESAPRESSARARPAKRRLRRTRAHHEPA